MLIIQLKSILTKTSENCLYKKSDKTLAVLNFREIYTIKKISIEGPGVYHRLGSSGASHGGIGGAGGCDGFVTCRLKRNRPYGNLYVPTEFGSGGDGNNGGSGGGILEIVVHNTLTVDGYVKSNSGDVGGVSDGSSGGSGGSIHVQTVNYTGEWRSHTGVLHVICFVVCTQQIYI